MNEHLGPLDEFIKANTGLVHHVARRYATAAKMLGLEYEDIVQEGFIGLIKAYHRFDSSYATKATTFAVPHIWGSIRLLLRDYGPVHAYRAEKEIAQHIYKAGLDDQSAAEIANQLGCTEKQATHALSYRQTTILSMDSPINIKDGQANLNNTLPSHDDQTGVYVDEFLSKLTAKQANVARQRLLGRTQAEIAREIGVSQAQIGRYIKNLDVKYLRVM